MKVSIRFILTFILTISTNIFASFAPGTEVLTSAGLISIEKLQVGDVITGYNSKDGTHPDVIIQNITSHEADFVHVIKTENGTIYASTDQLFYDPISNDFVEAEQLNTKNVLLTKDFEQVACTNIDVNNQKTMLYEVTLDQPHLLFTSGAKILTHNFSPAGALVVNTLMKKALELGTAIACVYLNKQSPQFDHLEQVTKRIWHDVEIFCAKYYKDNKPFKFNHDNFRDFVPYNQNLVDIAGLAVDPQSRYAVLCNPLRYGPMYPTGKMTPSGEVECTLYVAAFENWRKDGHPSFEWKPLSKEMLHRDHKLVKAFVAEEDRKDLKEIREYVASLPSGVRSVLFSTRLGIDEELKQIQKQHGCFIKYINSKPFGVHALKAMADKNISSWLVSHALKYGKTIEAKHPLRLICFDQKENVAVVVHKQSKTIMNVGRYNDLAMLNTEQEKTPEEKSEEKINKVLEGTIPGEVTKGRVKQYEKPGNYEDAQRDFDKMKLTDIKNIEKGKLGKLPDGRYVNVRWGSSDGRPTLEIQNKNHSVKIRYGI